MRVLHVIPSLSTRTGGPPGAVVGAALAMRDLGVDSTVVASDMATPAAAGRARRVTARDVPAGADALDVRLFRATAPRRFVFSTGMYGELQRMVRDYDVVHIHSLFLFPQFAAYRAAKRAGVPYVVSPRGALDPHLRQRNAAIKWIGDAVWQRRFLEGAAAIHVTSAEEARQIASFAPRVPRVMVPNGVRSADFNELPSADAFRARAVGRIDAPIVLFLGRVTEKKGIDVLIRAFASARERAGDAWLVIAGPDDERLTPALRGIAGVEGVADRVIFTDMLHHDAKLSALAAADIWALPSHGENFGNAVIEAMAAGRAVVVSPEVNIAADIEAAGAGIVAAGTVGGFADEIVRLLNDEQRRRAFGEAARTFARRYDWSYVAPQMLAMYERVAGRQRAVAA